jgi:hypothetical protein
VSGLGEFAPPITDFLGTAVIATVVEGVLGAVIYIG